MPEGSIGWHVDCADNPLDLRPAVATILRAIDERRAALPKDEILVVPVGEIHACPTQVWVFTLLAKEMKARGHDFVVSLERSHDTWKRNREDYPPAQIPDAPAHEIDPDGTLSLLELLSMPYKGHAPTSEKGLLRFLYEEKIKTVFNDASIRDNGVFSLLNRHDPLTRAAIKDHFSGAGLTKRLCFAFSSLESPDSFAIRNKISTALSLKYARQNEVPIVLASHGSRHLFGNTLKGTPYKDSLDALSGKQAAVLPVFMTVGRFQTGLNILEEDAFPSLKHSVVIDGLGEDGFLYGHHDDGEPGSPTYLAESAYIDQIRQATGGTLPGF